MKYFIFCLRQYIFPLKNMFYRSLNSSEEIVEDLMYNFFLSSSSSSSSLTSFTLAWNQDVIGPTNEGIYVLLNSSLIFNSSSFQAKIKKVIEISSAEIDDTLSFFLPFSLSAKGAYYLLFYSPFADISFLYYVGIGSPPLLLKDSKLYFSRLPIFLPFNSRNNENLDVGLIGFTPSLIDQKRQILLSVGKKKIPMVFLKNAPSKFTNVFENTLTYLSYYLLPSDATFPIQLKSSFSILSSPPPLGTIGSLTSSIHSFFNLYLSPEVIKNPSSLSPIEEEIKDLEIILQKTI